MGVKVTADEINAVFEDHQQIPDFFNQEVRCTCGWEGGLVASYNGHLDALISALGELPQETLV